MIVAQTVLQEEKLLLLSRTGKKSIHAQWICNMSSSFLFSFHDLVRILRWLTFIAIIINEGSEP